MAVRVSLHGIFFYSLSGGELFAHLAEKETLTEEECSHYIRQVLEGLHYIHSSNIIHMAVKVSVSHMIRLAVINCETLLTAGKHSTDFQPQRC